MRLLFVMFQNNNEAQQTVVRKPSFLTMQLFDLLLRSGLDETPSAFLKFLSFYIYIYIFKEKHVLSNIHCSQKEISSRNSSGGRVGQEEDISKRQCNKHQMPQRYVRKQLITITHISVRVQTARDVCALESNLECGFF